ncbi:MAG: hypothetical protein ABR607_11345 [Pyrinomonadaceae bacterium]
MKRCPKCDFSFADFHRVCDFDGATLLEDPERLPSFGKGTPQTGLRRLLKSPVLLAGLGMVGLLMSAILIGYYDSLSESTPLAISQPPHAFVSPVSRAQKSNGPGTEFQTQTKAGAASAGPPVESNSKGRQESASLARRRPRAAARSLAKFHFPDSARKQSRKSAGAQQAERADAANRKEPKLAAMLKTTWRVLKKPFKF